MAAVGFRPYRSFTVDWLWLSSESQNTSVAVADMFAKDAVVDMFAKYHNSFLLQQHCIGLESVIQNKFLFFFFGGWRGGGGGQGDVPSAVPTWEALLCAARPDIPTSGHTQDSFRITAPPPKVHMRRRQIVGGLPVRRRHCTAAESLRWCSVVPVLIEHTQDITCYAPYWRQY